MGTHIKEDYLIFAGRIENEPVSYAVFEVVDGDTHKKLPDTEPVNIDVRDMRAAKKYLLSEWLHEDPLYVNHQVGQLDLACKAIRLIEHRRLRPLMTRLGMRLEVLGL